MTARLAEAMGRYPSTSAWLTLMFGLSGAVQAWPR